RRRFYDQAARTRPSSPLWSPMTGPPSYPLISAPDSPLNEILANLPRISRSRAPVLVTGESGTGKEGIVRAMHGFAPWAAKPLIALNCGAIPPQLLESELFGHVRGAFTGADRPRVGSIEA